MSFILKWLPGLGPAFTAFANPWVLLAAGLVLAGAFFYGLSIGNDRLESYQVAVKAVGELQEERTKLKIAEANRIKKESDNAHRMEVMALNTAVGDLRATIGKLQQRPSGSFLPTIPAGSSLSKSIKPSLAAEFDRALQEYHADIRRAVGSSYAEIAGLVAEGARNAIDLQCGRDWVQQHKGK